MEPPAPRGKADGTVRGIAFGGHGETFRFTSISNFNVASRVGGGDEEDYLDSVLSIFSSYYPPSPPSLFFFNFYATVILWLARRQRGGKPSSPW